MRKLGGVGRGLEELEKVKTVCLGRSKSNRLEKMRTERLGPGEREAVQAGLPGEDRGPGLWQQLPTPRALSRGPGAHGLA